MTVELQPSESGTEGVRRIARAQIAKALSALDAKSLSDERVHAARKELKKARASVRLLRNALGEAVYNRENAALRDCARPLSRIRDGKVLVDTLDRLTERFGAAADAIPLEALRRALVRQRAGIRRATLKGTVAMTSHREALRKAYERTARWPVGKRGWSVVGAGFQRIYCKGRKALAASEADRTPTNLHEWRKQVKYFWHQLQALQPLWPGPIGELADQAHQLADYLGDDHDLSVLRAHVLESKEAFPNVGMRGALLSLIDRRRTELRDKAIVLGRRLYQEKPAAIEARFSQYWRDWQRRR
jgi:CHAD domain-containing protein